MDDRMPDGDSTPALRRIGQLFLHLRHPSPSSVVDEGQLAALPCGSRERTVAAVSVAELAQYMRGRHREIQDRVFEFFRSRPDLQTPVEISTADHRELCMRQLTALVRDAGIRPFRYVLEDPSLYFAISEAVGGIDISLGIKMGVQYR